MTPSRWLVLFCAASLAFATGCRTSKVRQSEPAEAGVEESTNASGYYLRIAQPRTNVIELQIALREFLPPERSQPVVWLSGVSHIGESNYYARLQQHLDAQELVLYEGVSDRATRLQQKRKSKYSEPQPLKPDEEEASIQNTLAEALELAFQLTSIDYSRPHFHNSDLTIEEIQSLIVKETSGAGRPSKTASEFQKLLAMMEGDGMAAFVMQAGLRLISSSPKLRALARLMMIETLGRFGGNVSELAGLPPEWQRLVQILIESRNEAVLKDLRAELLKKRAPKSVSIFYGAAHMGDFQKRLVNELNYRAGRAMWLPAFSVDLEKAQLTEAEVQMIRSFVDWQLNLIRQQADE